MVSGHPWQNLPATRLPGDRASRRAGGRPMPLSNPTILKRTPVNSVTGSASRHSSMRPSPRATPNSMAVTLSLPKNFSPRRRRSAGPRRRGAGRRGRTESWRESRPPIRHGGAPPARRADISIRGKHGLDLADRRGFLLPVARKVNHGRLRPDSCPRRLADPVRRSWADARYRVRGVRAAKLSSRIFMPARAHCFKRRGPRARKVPARAPCRASQVPRARGA